MQEQRNKKRQGDIVEQINRQVEILAETDGLERVKDKCGQANRRKMQDERRTAALA